LTELTGVVDGATVADPGWETATNETKPAAPIRRASAA
jgi:hypothetical protein